MPEKRRTENDFYVQGSDIEKETFLSENELTVEWNIIYSCNYRCSYCFFSGKWEEYSKRNVILPPDEMIRHWERVHEEHGRVSLLITGGEPMVYPGFSEIIAGISRFHYPVNISTNGSRDFSALISSCDPSKISVSLSFHPEYTRLSQVLSEKKTLAGQGFVSEFINLVAYPEYFGSLEKWIREASAAGEKLKVIPFSGQYGGREYPDSYTDEQKEFLGLDSSWEANVKRKNSLCMAGVRSVLIFPDGKVSRCGQIGEKQVLCNFFSDGLKLFKSPVVCENENCPCIESP